MSVSYIDLSKTPKYYIFQKYIAQKQMDEVHCMPFVLTILSEFLLFSGRIPHPLFPRHHDVTSQLSSRPTNENAAYQWTGSQNVTQGQTQYGYNYHHIDQRTENQTSHPACVDTKSNSQQNTTDVYAEFTTDATAIQCGSEQAESYYETGVNAKYSLVDPGSKFQYKAESQYGHDSNSMCTSELQCSQYQADGQSQYESDQAQCQFDGQPLYQSDVLPEREDHARYVPEGYVHFLLSR